MTTTKGLAPSIWAMACLVFCGCPGSGGGAQAGVLDALTTPLVWADPHRADTPIAEALALRPGDAACVGPSPGQPLGLAQAMVLALCNAAEVRLAEVDVARQAAGLGQARAAYWPTLGLGFTDTRENKETTLGSDSIASAERSTGESISLNYRLLDSGARSNTTEAAKHFLAGAQANYVAALHNVAVRAAKVYTEVAAAQVAFVADKQAESSARDLTQLAHARRARGLGSGFELGEAEVAQAKAALSVRRSRASLEAASHQLRYLTRLDHAADFQLVEAPQVPAAATAVPLEWDRKLERMLAQHPALQSLRLQVQAAQDQVRSAVAEGLPTLDWSASRFVNGRPGQAVGSEKSVQTVVSLTLNIPVFEGFGRIYKTKAAHSNVVGKAAELADAELRMLADARRLRDEWTSAIASEDAAGQWVQWSERSVAGALLRYQRGLSDITEVIRVQTELNTAQKERSRAQSDRSKAYVELLGHLAVLDLAALRTGVVTDCQGREGEQAACPSH